MALPRRATTCAPPARQLPPLPLLPPPLLLRARVCECERDESRRLERDARHLVNKSLLYEFCTSLCSDTFVQFINWRDNASIRHKSRPNFFSGRDTVVSPLCVSEISQAVETESRLASLNRFI